MSALKHTLFDLEEIDKLQKKLTIKGFDQIYHQEKHQLQFNSDQDIEIKVRLPLQVVCHEDNTLETVEERPFVMLIVESGQAALAYGEGKHIIEHKVFKAYMVRKKQGKSQLKHLKTKGKSKAGSRVRLANTAHFFEEIQEKITEWINYFEVEYIGLSCTKSLYPHLFNEDFELDRKDERIIKIPQHIHEANFENMLSIHRYLISPELIYQEEHEELVKAVLAHKSK